MKKFEMLKQLKKISLVSAGNIVNAFFGVAFLTAIARTLSLEDFGKYALLTTILVSMSKVIDFGSNSYYVTDSLTDKKYNLDTFITLKILLFILATVVGIITLKLIDIFDIKTLFIFVSGIVAYVFNTTMFAFFQKVKKYEFAVGLNSLPAFIKLIFAVFILLGFVELNLHQAFAVFSFSVFSSLLLITKLPQEFSKIKLGFTNIKSLGIKSAPGGIALVIQNSWPTISNSIAKIAQNFESAGIFSIADKIASIFSLISISVFTVLLPENAERKEEHKKYNFEETFYIAIIILILAVIATITAQILLPLIFGEKYLDSNQLVGVLIFSSAFTAIHTFLDNFFYIENEIKFLMYVNILKLFIFLFLGIIFIQHFSLVGLAYAHLLTSIFALGITSYKIKKVSIHNN